jgi:plastocyanin
MDRLSRLGIPRAGQTAALIALVAAAGVVASAPVVARRAGGTIAGVVTTKAAALAPIRVTIDPNVCGDSLSDEAITVDAAGHVANVVFVVPGVKAPVPGAEAQVANEKCRFVPCVSILQPGGTVKMMSKDPMIHTMHAATADARALFNLSLPFPNITLSRPIDKPGVVTLTCSTHTWMRGYLNVTDELAGMSGADGKFRIDGVPAGTHELRVWHEALKTSAPVKVTVRDGETASVDVVLVK